LRLDGRENTQIRNITIEKNVNMHAEGSVLISVGNTKVICTATIEEKVPSFMRGQNKGWISAEYAMLPRATQQRTMRESAKGKQTGRTMEIQRLIGRALRSIVDLESLGERTIWIDCDVIQADGGTRTTSITGAFVALALAVEKLHKETPFEKYPIKDFLAATSVGILEDGEIVVDLNYVEDSEAQVDMNIVMTGVGDFVEIQGTGEESTFSYKQLMKLLENAEQGLKEVFEVQKNVLGIEIVQNING